MESYKLRTSHKIFSRSKTNIATSNCKKHPKHKQSPGVCSICVNEKLFQLSNPSRKKVKKNTQSLSSSSSDTSSDHSSCSSPAMKHAAQRRIESNGVKSFKVYGQNALKKSRSMVFGLTRKKEEKRIKSGFWSKLLTGKTKGLMHSKEKESLRFATVHIS